MFHNSFKMKMFLITLIPALALFYLSVNYMYEKYQSQKHNQQLMYFTYLMQSSSQLVHNLQVERGLSAGYISSAATQENKNKLLAQEKKTDLAYKNFLKLLKTEKENMHTVNELTFNHYKYLLNGILSQLSALKTTREQVLKEQISFNEMLNFYNSANAKLIHIIKIVTLLFKHPLMGPLDIYNLELLKEKAGQERAYMYHLLLSKIKKEAQILNVQTLISEQNALRDEFLHSTSEKYRKLYYRFVTPDITHQINTLRRKIFASNFDKKYAQEWFEKSTLRINTLEAFALYILKNYLHTIETLYAEANRSFFISLLMWVLSFVAFIFLSLIVNKLINRQTGLLKDLQIASYTFNSHEAIIITDPYGIIVKTNKAFSEITGYSPEESVGQSTKILKSFRHDEAFYAHMWNTLSTQGHWSGEIQNRRKNGELFFEKLSITAITDAQGNTTNYIAQFIDITELKRAKERAEYQSEHDFLTDLPNRKALISKLKEELARAKRHHYLDAFVFLDLDGFKAVNDNYGHKVGDSLLLEVAQRLRKSIREEDFVARISGDEFAIILCNFSLDKERAKEDITKIATKIVESLNRPFMIDGVQVNIGASLGIRFFPEDASDTSSIIRDADSAMYMAKENGKNQFVFYCQTQ